MMDKIKQFFKENIGYILVIILVIGLKVYVVSPIKVNGKSMNDTLLDKDIMILDELSYRFNDIERFDIVVVKAEGEYIIKRVIGLPSETIKYENNKLYVNGVEVEDNYSSEPTNDFEVKVPAGKYFVLGDNRTNSTDSRVIGAVSKNQIKGKTSFTIYPFNRFGKKN